MGKEEIGKIFPGSYSSLPEIGKYINKACREAGCDSTTTYYVETAVDEACSNIIEHAYGGENIGDIHCICLVNDIELTVVLNDHGKPFDPDKVPPPDMKVELEDRSNHGLGLYMIRKIMDEVKFQFSSQSGNTLTLVKYLQKK